MCSLDSEPPLEAGLDIEEIEKRLVATSARYDFAARTIAYYLLEVEERELFKKRGFSSIYDFADKLIELNRRKTQTLLTIARRLDELPKIAEAFDSGEIGWTKVREITKVATKDTEKEWLEKARRSSCRELEKAVRRKSPSSGRFHTIQISMPEDVLNLWVQCEEIAERQAEKTLEPWQVLEQMMAEYLSTYAAAQKELISHRRETEDEQEIPLETRLQVLERDGHRCRFPGCSMRVFLGLHHIVFRSQGGGHEPENLLVLCDAHHTLVHDRICSVEGTAPDNLEFKGPFLSEFPWMMEEARKRASGSVTAKEEEAGKQETEANAAGSQPECTDSSRNDEPSGECESSGEDESSEDWRDETVAAIFDGPPTERPEPVASDPITPWLNNYMRRKRKERLMRRSQGGHGEGNNRDHVIADGGNGKPKHDHVIAGRKSSHRGRCGSVLKTPPGSPSR